MLLAGRNGDQFELNLHAYQFPKIEDDEWDSNWLQIRISATNERGSWTATDSSLVTREVMLLADWLKAIADRDEVATELEFTEPNLSFELVEVTDRVRLRAWFVLELRPRWARSYDVPARDLCVDLDLASADLLAAAESLRAQLRRFPPRAGRE